MGAIDGASNEWIAGRNRNVTYNMCLENLLYFLEKIDGKTLEAFSKNLWYTDKKQSCKAPAPAGWCLFVSPRLQEARGGSILHRNAPAPREAQHISDQFLLLSCCRGGKRKIEPISLAHMSADEI